MRKLVLWDLVTLDGRFEGATPWSLGHHGLVWGDALEAYSLQQLGEAGTLLFGRRTFDGMAAHFSGETGPIEDRMNSIDKVVATRAGQVAAWSGARVLQGDIADHIAALKAEPGGDIFVFGSAELTARLREIGAVDEMRLFLVPTILGEGAPMFPAGGAREDFRLIEARAFDSGGVLLRYVPAA